MKCHRKSSIAGYLSPGSSSWADVAEEDVGLIPTPLPMQPTEYIRKKWENKPYGDAKSLKVATVHDGHTIAVRIRWTGVSAAGGDFPDAVAVALPVRGKPILAMMGAEDAPIHILRWQANKEGVRSIIATGIGQSAVGPTLKTGAEAKAEGDSWSVVITRALGQGKNVAPLAAGKKTGIGFALWRGSNDERAGIKAFSIDWAELALDA